MSAAPPARPISIHALLAESDPQPGLYRATHGYFYPRSPCGERPRCIVRPVPGPQISIHALLAESDPQPGGTGLSADHFYPRSPCGERPAGSAHDAARLAHFYPRSPCGERLRHGRQPNPPPEFLSTLSLQRATDRGRHGGQQCKHFYPRSPCGERLSMDALESYLINISIHALLAESDDTSMPPTFIFASFLSTLSLRRATSGTPGPRLHPQFLSTLSLRRATVKSFMRNGFFLISIHALLAESDVPIKRWRPALMISIHALLAESDAFYNATSNPANKLFLSTLSLRRAT